MNLYSLNTVYPLVDTFYGIEANTDDFEDLALAAWNIIGNKHTILYRYIGDTCDNELALPCNAEMIESVSIPIADAQWASDTNPYGNTFNIFTEEYIDVWKKFDSPYETKGMLIKYKEGNKTLYFNKNYKNVMVVYHGVILDGEDELPKITEKEQRAITAYVAYFSLFKDGIKRKDKNSIELANLIKADWIRLCNAARIPEHLSQNDMNMILDAKFRSDRKSFGKSFKPII